MMTIPPDVADDLLLISSTPDDHFHACRDTPAHGRHKKVHERIAALLTEGRLAACQMTGSGVPQ
jgi:hypothetical protein